MLHFQNKYSSPIKLMAFFFPEASTNSPDQANYIWLGQKICTLTQIYLKIIQSRKPMRGGRQHCLGIQPKCIWLLHHACKSGWLVCLTKKKLKERRKKKKKKGKQAYKGITMNFTYREWVRAVIFSIWAIAVFSFLLCQSIIREFLYSEVMYR